MITTDAYSLLDFRHSTLKLVCIMVITLKVEVELHVHDLCLDSVEFWELCIGVNSDLLPEASNHLDSLKVTWISSSLKG